MNTLAGHGWPNAPPKADDKEVKRPAGSPWRLRVDDLTVDYGKTRALDRISFDIDSNSIVAVFGENGAGKSTLLWAVSGLLLPSFGRIDYPSKSSLRIGFSAHQSFLYDDLTVMENMILSARLNGVSDPQVPVREWLDRLGLERVSAKPVSALSRGQKQLVSFARAVFPAPHILLLDEPFSNLDAAGANEVCQIIASMRSPDTLILLASHDRPAASRLATHVLEIRAGRAAPLQMIGR